MQLLVYQFKKIYLY